MQKQVPTGLGNNLIEAKRSEESKTTRIESVKVLLLAGGKGTRLAAVSGNIHKGLVTIDQNGAISGSEHASRVLDNLGLTDVTFLVDYQAEQYEQFAKEKNYSLIYQKKEHAGTGYALEEAIEIFGFDRQYLVIATDTYFSASDVVRLLDSHRIETVTWGVSLPNSDLHMETYHGLVIDSQNRVIGDVKQYWWQNRSTTNLQLVTKGAIQIIDPVIYTHSTEVFKRLARNPSSIDVYWDIMPLMEEQNRRHVSRGKSSIINAVIFDDDLIDYGTPERLAIVRKRYDLESVKRVQ